MACSGNGCTVSDAIPKKDQDSGATGGALYGGNQINARRGCAACGGQGLRYEGWYLIERPATGPGDQGFRRGSGKRAPG